MPSWVTIRRLTGAGAVLVLAIVAGLGGARLLADGALATPGPGANGSDPSLAPPSAEVSTPASPPQSASASAPASPPNLPPVPQDLAGMAWVAFNGEAYVAGTLGAGAMFTLPVGEIGLDARGDLVLSTDEARSTLMVRDLSSGAVLGVADTGLIIDNGLLRGDQVYVSARSTDGSVDAGVLTGTSPGLELQQLLLAAPGGPRIGETRAPVKVSPSGLTIGSTVCTTETPCGVQSVNLTSGALTTIDDFYLRWISDEVAIVSQGPLLRAYALSNLKLLWTIGDETPANEYQDGYFRGDGALVLQWLTGDGDDRRYEIVLVDSTTGDVTVVASFEPEARTYIAAALSTDTRVVLVSESTVEGAVRDGAELQVLNLATRAIEKYASPFAGTSQ